MEGFTMKKYACCFDGNTQNRIQEDAKIDGVELF